MKCETVAVDKANLLRFLRDAHRHGYVAGRDALSCREADHSTTIVHEAGEWRFHDNFFGGEPYGGRAVVCLQRRPVWLAVFYGQVAAADTEVQSVYSFLQRALRRAPEHLPFRGPEEFSEGAFMYRNALHGDVENFWGEETIFHSGQHVYTARYAGGLVDRRSGD
jgi:hypothetical protein